MQVAIWDSRAITLRRQISLAAPEKMHDLFHVQASSDGRVITAACHSGHVGLPSLAEYAKTPHLAQKSWTAPAKPCGFQA